MENKPWIDPIVEEVRAAREALFQEAGYDLKRLNDRLMESQKRHGDRLVENVSRGESRKRNKGV